MSQSFNFKGNVGWTLWNFSKRLSIVKERAKYAQHLSESLVGMNDWRIEDLTELRAITARLHECAERADETWRKLNDAVIENDADLLDQHEDVVVIRGGGSRPDLHEKILRIYRADKCDVDSETLMARIDLLKRNSADK